MEARHGRECAKGSGVAALVQRILLTSMGDGVYNVYTRMR